MFNRQIMIDLNTETKSGLSHLWIVIVRKGGPRGTRQKKLQNLDSIQLQGEPKGLPADIGSLEGFSVNGHVTS
jgi:hypothetical protein